MAYFSKHNHPLNFQNSKHQPLKLSVRNLIKAHLILSVSVSKIKEILQDGAGMRDNGAIFPLKEHFITNKAICAYRRHINKALYPSNDVLSLTCIVNKLKTEKYDSVLIYKPKGSTTLSDPSDLDNLQNSLDLFAIGIQTSRQKDMMIQGCKDILCIDSTHKTNHYDYYLINLIVPDQFGCCYPVAHFIINVINIETITCLFKSIKIRIPDLNVNCVMTDDDKVLFPSFAKVFGPDIKHLLCSWHIEQSWKRQLQNKVKTQALTDEMFLKLREIRKEKMEAKLNDLLKVL